MENKLLDGSSNGSDHAMESRQQASTVDNSQEKHGLRRLTELTKRSFYEKDGWFDDMCDLIFKIKSRGTTVRAECYFGLIHFISCSYCLAVIPQQLSNAGYNLEATVVSVAGCCGIGSMFFGVFANLPFVLAPPAVVSIYLSAYLQQNNTSASNGNVAVILSGVALMIFGFRTLGRLVARLIPQPIQVGSAVGIGLLTALSGSTEINLVERGNLTVLRMGKITNEICIAMTGVVLISIALNYHVKGAFCFAVVFCSLVWWISENSFPTSVAGIPRPDLATYKDLSFDQLPLLVLDLLFLYLLYLNGIVTSLSNLAVLTREDGATPRGRWIFIMSGIFTVIGGIFSSAPVLVSPESSASIKAGAKTGLSTFVCGILFLVAMFFYPIFKQVPAAGTSPILIMIGVILFQNVNRIDWRNVTDAAPAFVVLFYIPFTYSVIQGVILGYIVYALVSFFKGDLINNAIFLTVDYFPKWEHYLTPYRVEVDLYHSLHAALGFSPPSSVGEEEKNLNFDFESPLSHGHADLLQSSTMDCETASKPPGMVGPLPDENGQAQHLSTSSMSNNPHIPMMDRHRAASLDGRLDRSREPSIVADGSGMPPERSLSTSNQSQRQLLMKKKSTLTQASFLAPEMDGQKDPDEAPIILNHTAEFEMDFRISNVDATKRDSKDFR